MLASLILSNASTAGIMSAGAVQSLGVGRKLDLDKLIKGSIFGGALVLKGLNKVVGKGGLTGINFSLSSILRQSQIFTTSVGSFFQIAGAYLDVTFAPLMPKIIKGLNWLGRKLPGFTAGIDVIVDWLRDKWEIAKQKFTAVINSIRAILGFPKLVVDTTKDIITGDRKIGGSGKIDKTEVITNVLQSATLLPLPLTPYSVFANILMGVVEMPPTEKQKLANQETSARAWDPDFGKRKVTNIPSPTPNNLTGAMLMRPEFNPQVGVLGVAQSTLPGAMIMRPTGGVRTTSAADLIEQNQSVAQTRGAGDAMGVASGTLATFFANQGKPAAAQRMYAQEAIQQRVGGSVHALYQPKVETYEKVAALHGASVESIAQHIDTAPQLAQMGILARMR